MDAYRETLMGTRRCRDCTTCCTVLEITESTLNKPYGVKCPHLKRRCTIYAERPQTCQQFECMWLQGLGNRSDRPDRLGAIWTQQANDQAPGGVLYIVYTFKDTEQGAERIRDVVSQGRHVYEVRPDRSHTYHTPQGSIENFKQEAHRG